MKKTLSIILAIIIIAATIPFVYAEDNYVTEVTIDGVEGVILGGEMYLVNGDITNTGIHIGDYSVFNDCYKAGDGYVTLKGEGNNDTVVTLYDATIDVRGNEYTEAFRVSGEDVEIRFFGENNLFADADVYSGTVGYADHSHTFVGADDAVMNLYGNVTACDIFVKSGTINVYGADDENEASAVYLENQLVISAGAVVNIISGDNGLGLNSGILTQRGIVADGELNAIILSGTETSTEMIYNLTAVGDAVLGADTYNPYFGLEIPEDIHIEVNFMVPEGTSVTIPEGITLNLDSFDNVNVDGKIIVNGTLICTHTGGTAICDKQAVCDVCGLAYGEKPTHTDADGDYICDNGCGYEYEKPVEDEICEDCEKVHSNFFSEIICFFIRIIKFIKNLFA